MRIPEVLEIDDTKAWHIYREADDVKYKPLRTKVQGCRNNLLLHESQEDDLCKNNNNKKEQLQVGVRSGVAALNS